eukprot:5146395-Alexandrium_andersonii.AAC.1
MRAANSCQNKRNLRIKYPVLRNLSALAGCSPLVCRLVAVRAMSHYHNHSAALLMVMMVEMVR